MTQPLIRHTAPHSFTARSTQTKNIALQNERVVDLKTRSCRSRSLAWYFLSPLDIKTTDLVPSLQSYKSLPGQIIAAIAVIAQARNEVETLSKWPLTRLVCLAKPGGFVPSPDPYGFVSPFPKFLPVFLPCFGRSFYRVFAFLLQVPCTRYSLCLSVCLSVCLFVRLHVSWLADSYLLVFETQLPHHFEVAWPGQPQAQGAWSEGTLSPLKSQRPAGGGCGNGRDWTLPQRVMPTAIHGIATRASPAPARADFAVKRRQPLQQRPQVKSMLFIFAILWSRCVLSWLTSCLFALFFLE